MGELFIELFSEEIPARMQARAADNLQRLVCEKLKQTGLVFDKAQSYVTPRRLALCVEGLPKKSPAQKEERKGPRVGAPDKAIGGFLRGAGLASIDDAEIVSDPKKGDYYLAVFEEDGQATADIVSAFMPELIKGFPWPKSMRSGARSFRWVRPLQSIICLFGGKVIPFDVEGIESGAVTQGHRFLSPKPFKVKNFEAYQDKLGEAYVILDMEARAELIAKEARKLAKAKKLALVDDKGLVYENAGLTEWPQVMMGSFDKDFLSVPAEVLTMAMKSHQKCFSLRKGGKLSNHFLLVSNMVAADGGKAIVAGNERVIRARLADAKFFYEQDLKAGLAVMGEKLGSVTFHEKLGTQAERVERISKLARDLAPHVGAEPDVAERAARLCKADLASGMVGEFPELQGLMGRYYALEQNEPADIAQAIEEHYRPQGPDDEVPSNSVSVAVALADKLDTLVGFWAIDEKPTGSKDPYALRRAALGVVRLILNNRVRLQFEELCRHIHSIYADVVPHLVDGHWADELISGDGPVSSEAELMTFLADRLKVYLRDRGARHDLIDAVFALGDQDDLLMIVKRVEALGAFLDTDDGANLLAGTKRAQNILRIEEKKDKRSFDGAVGEALLSEKAEIKLAKTIQDVRKRAEKAVGEEDFEGAMAQLAKLRGPVDLFFDDVTVNADDPHLRENRLKLLNEIRSATRQVADFTKIEG